MEYTTIIAICVGVVGACIFVGVYLWRCLRQRKLVAEAKAKVLEEEKRVKAIRDAEAADRIRRPEYYAQLEREKEEQRYRYQAEMRRREEMSRAQEQQGGIALVMLYQTNQVQKSKCNSCRGTGQQYCYKCNGGRYLPCDMCKGLGRRGSNMTCGNCHEYAGSGKQRCWICQGSGSRNCGPCNGSGYF